MLTKRSKFVWCGVLMLVLCAAGGLCYWYLEYLDGKARKQLETVRGGMTFPQVPPREAWQLYSPKPTVEQNAAEIYAKIFARDKSWVSPDMNASADFDKNLDKLFSMWEKFGQEAPDEPLDISWTRSFLAEIDYVYPIIDEAAKCPHCFSIESWPVGAPRPEPNFSLGMARLYNAERAVSGFEQHEGHTQNAYKHLARALRIVSHEEQDPNVWGQTFAFIARHSTLGKLRTLLAEAAPSDSTAAALEASLTERNYNLRDVVAIWCLIDDSEIGDFVDGRTDFQREFDPMSAGLKSANYVPMGLAMALRLKGHSKLVSYRTEFMSLCKRLYDNISDDPANNLIGPCGNKFYSEDLRCDRDNIFVPHRISSKIRLVRDWSEDRLQCIMSQIAVMVAKFKESHGQYPKSLSDLPDAARLPNDPFSGQPFRYRVDAGGFTLWTVGPNRVNIGEDGGPNENGDDFIFKVGRKGNAR
jgi:hypothetical protein